MTTWKELAERARESVEADHDATEGLGMDASLQRQWLSDFDALKRQEDCDHLVVGAEWLSRGRQRGSIVGAKLERLTAQSTTIGVRWAHDTSATRYFDRNGWLGVFDRAVFCPACGLEVSRG